MHAEGIRNIKETNIKNNKYIYLKEVGWSTKSSSRYTLKFQIFYIFVKLKSII